MKRKRSNQVEPPEAKSVVKDEVAVFEKPLEQTSIKSSQMCEYGSLVAVSNQGPIEFRIPKSDRYYTDMSEVYLEVELSVEKSDGTKLDATDETKITPVNNFFGALFSR